MEVACSFPHCIDRAQQFLLLSTHKQPLCDQHFSTVIVSNRSRATVLDIEEWWSITRKEQLPINSEADVFSSLLNLADSIENAAELELSRLIKTAMRELKTQCRHANRLARAMLVLNSAERANLIQAKSIEIRFLFQQLRFNRGLCSFLSHKINTEISSLKNELRLYSSNDSVELTPLASTFAASHEFLAEFTPCIVDSRDGINPELQSEIWPVVVFEHLKKVEVERDITKALCFSLRARPIYAELMDMKKELRNVSNDSLIDTIESFPEICKALTAQLEELNGPSFVCRRTREKLSVESFLISEAFNIRTKVAALTTTGNPNELRDLSDLQTYAVRHNQAGVLAFRTNRYCEAAQIFKAARKVRKRLPECEVKLSRFTKNLKGAYERLKLFSKAAAEYRSHADSSYGMDTPSGHSIKISSILCILYTLGNQLHEAELWGRKTLALVTGSVPVVNNAHFQSLRYLSNVMVAMRDFAKAAELSREGLNLCFRVGAASEPLSEVCLALADSELHLQHFNEAAVLLNQAEALIGARWNVRLLQGKLLLKLYRLPEARSLLLGVARTNTACRARVHLSEIARYEEHFYEAWQWLARASALPIENLYILNIAVSTACGLICLDTGDLNTAEKWLNSAWELHQCKLKEVAVHGVLLRALGRLAMEQKRYAQAEETLKIALTNEEKILNTHSNVGLTYQHLGVVYLLQDRFADSERCLFKALQIQQAVIPLHPDVADTYFHVAQLHLAQQDISRASQAAVKSIEINEALRPAHSSLAKAYMLFARILQQVGNDSEATDYLKKSLAIFEQKPHCAQLATAARALLSPSASNTP